MPPLEEISARAEVHGRIEVDLVVKDGVHRRGQLVDAQAPGSLELGRRGVVVWCKSLVILKVSALVCSLMYRLTM